MGNDPKEAYDKLIDTWKALTVLASCGSVLGWDEQTYMPGGGATHRGNQRAALSGVVHEQLTSPKIGDMIAEAQDGISDDGTGVEAVNMREIKRSYERAIKLPRELIEEMARVTSQSHVAWKDAREKSDFSIFQPWLEKVLELKKREAGLLSDGGTLYDALMDDYETGATVENLTPILSALRDELTTLVAEIADSGHKADTSFLHKHFPEASQETFGCLAAAAFGFDFDRGRLDVTTHPFCSGIGPGDTRITTRYDESFFPMALYGILHEVGHGIYSQGLNQNAYGTPMGGSVSLGIHESQSRMWENFVGRSHAFWVFFLSQAQEIFPDALKGITVDKMYAGVNAAEPSFIRVEADEVTYNLHILLRFEMEQILINDDLPASDVPGVWNEMFEKSFGLTPPDDANGCLQDIHWSGGGIGYFPTYTLGNLNAAQFFVQARTDLGDLDAQFAKGDFATLRGWLTEKIYLQGMRFHSGDLMENVTGKPLSHQPLVDHLRGKFGPLYGLG